MFLSWSGANSSLARNIASPPPRGSSKPRLTLLSLSRHIGRNTGSWLQRLVGANRRDQTGRKISRGSDSAGAGVRRHGHDFSAALMSIADTSIILARKRLVLRPLNVTAIRGIDHDPGPGGDEGRAHGAHAVGQDGWLIG